MKHHQRGISFIGMLFCRCCVKGGFLWRAQVAPTMIEFQANTKAATKVSGPPL
jgi:hypothetical protein